ncbi:hypothetical protein LguiB_026610 [Lonicera macranthoides]
MGDGSQYTLSILHGDDLKQLIEDVYIQEAERIKSQPFDSPIERDKYLEMCGSAHDTALDNLKSALDAVQKFFPIDPTKGDIANNTLTYVELGINVAFQTLRNYSVRLSYVQKLSDHANALLSALEELDPQNVINARRLANDAIKYRDAMVRYLQNYKNGLSTAFSNWVKSQGLTFAELVEKFQLELGYEGEFSDLEDTQKLEVYKKIIKESGQEDIFQMEMDITEVGGVAVFLLTAETFARDTVQTFANISGGLIGNVIADVAATIVADTILASEIFLTGVALLSGIGATFIIAEIAGLFLDISFGSGGKKVFSTDNIKCYVAPLPDGAEIANQILHDKNIQASEQPLGAKA